MVMRLDNRRSLYGETRLTDAQVIALRGASANILRRTPQGWFVAGHYTPVSAATLANLVRRRALRVEPDGEYRVTASGESLRVMIDAAAGA